jgi:hypothetical protein
MVFPSPNKFGTRSPASLLSPNAVLRWIASFLMYLGRNYNTYFLKCRREPGDLSGLALGYGLDDRGFESRQGMGIFLFTTASRLALGPTQPPIQWVSGALSPGVKRSRCEIDHSPPSSSEVKECVELYLHSPNTPSWRGAQLKKAQGQLYLYLHLYTSWKL